MQYSNLQNGINIITEAAARMPYSPGVYKMISGDGTIMYIGKAKILPKRVISYASVERLPYRLKMMISQLSKIEFLVAETEAQALLLEANLINTISPKYNILLKDDKSFPYVAIEESHSFPRISKYRGSKKEKGSYYGPFASVQAVNEAISELQKAFKIRPCTDSYFASRSKPCLQYQIKRCSAPCVDKISEEEYKENVQEAKNFLSGKNAELQAALAEQMKVASDAMDFEKAAEIRDKIKFLTQIQSRNINFSGNFINADLFALYQDEIGNCCIQVFFIRNSKNFGNKAYFIESLEDKSAIIEQFVLQFYHVNPVAESIILSHVLDDKSSIESALSLINKKSKIILPSASNKLNDLMQFALENAKQSLINSLSAVKRNSKTLKCIKEALYLDKMPHLIEVYDNSHMQGSHAFGCYIAAEDGVLNKKLYRVFKISSKQGVRGDDYAMMIETITRRFNKANEKPDLIIIDGGKGQLSSVLEALSALSIKNVEVVAMSKGVDRNSGREFFHIKGRDPFQLPIGSPALRCLHTLRNEAHRFAITTHRKSMIKSISKSGIDGIPKIGKVRKAALLNHFGSFELLKRASIKDIERVSGISTKIAKIIYDYLDAI